MIGVVLGLICAPGPALLEVPSSEEPLVDILDVLPGVALDLVYATESNFANVRIYDTARCLVRQGVARKLAKAQAWLDANHKGVRLMFKDCYRPDRAQWILWKAVSKTPKARYVADPRGATGSLHSRGASVDVTLRDEHGELDMGTPHDFLGELAEPRLEARMLAEGKLSEDAVRNRRILRQALRAGGMRGIAREWWHFDDADVTTVKARYSRLDVPLKP